jgi:hypothetical protein
LSDARGFWLLQTDEKGMPAGISSSVKQANSPTFAGPRYKAESAVWSRCALSTESSQIGTVDRKPHSALCDSQPLPPVRMCLLVTSDWRGRTRNTVSGASRDEQDW